MERAVNVWYTQCRPLYKWLSFLQSVGPCIDLPTVCSHLVAYSLIRLQFPMSFPSDISEGDMWVIVIVSHGAGVWLQDICQLCTLPSPISLEWHVIQERPVFSSYQHGLSGVMVLQDLQSVLMVLIPLLKWNIYLLTTLITPQSVSHFSFVRKSVWSGTWIIHPNWCSMCVCMKDVPANDRQSWFSNPKNPFTTNKLDG